MSVMHEPDFMHEAMTAVVVNMQADVNTQFRLTPMQWLAIASVLLDVLRVCIAKHNSDAKSIKTSAEQAPLLLKLNIRRRLKQELDAATYQSANALIVEAACKAAASADVEKLALLIDHIKREA